MTAAANGLGAGVWAGTLSINEYRAIHAPRSCPGCGAPVVTQTSECEYCKRPTGVSAPMIEVTCLSDDAPRHVPAQPAPDRR